ncbi:uncharacterized protein LOC144307709 [Canis aureus]
MVLQAPYGKRCTLQSLESNNQQVEVVQVDDAGVEDLYAILKNSKGGLLKNPTITSAILFAQCPKGMFTKSGVNRNMKGNTYFPQRPLMWNPSLASESSALLSTLNTIFTSRLVLTRSHPNPQVTVACPWEAWLGTHSARRNL